MIPGAVNIGVFEKEGKAVLIDSGNDKDAGRRINRQLQDLGLELGMIVNTHANADHIGGNAYFQRKTDCRIAVTELEAPFVLQPMLESAFLFGGFPFSGLQNKFLHADPSRVTDRIPSDGPILDTGLTAFPLPGHYFDMIGIRTPDDVVFLADSLFPEEIITKYHIFYIFDVAKYLETLDLLSTLQARLFVPSHCKPTKSIKRLIDINRGKVTEICDVVTGFCTEAVGFDELLHRVCTHYAIDLDANQYVLLSSTLRSYLSYLEGRGVLVPLFEDRRMTWVRAGM